MRKTLILILFILLVILAVFTIFQGISIGYFHILSTSGVIELSSELTAKIEEANEKIKDDLQSKQTELSESVQTLLENKESYYKIANVSTQTEINQANTEEVYSIEYLWLRIGSHARSEGVNIRMDVINGENEDSTVKNLSFTVVGQYVGIMDFISALEEDSILAFTIENFDLVPADDNLQATFYVTGIRINLEDTTTSTEEEVETETTTENDITTEEEQTDTETATEISDAS